MVKIWNRWVRLVENFFEAKISTTKRTIQILLFYILSFSLAFLASGINRELGLIIFLSILISSALVIIALLYSIVKEIIMNMGMSLEH